MEPLRQRLRRGEPIVGDGAWGTQLMERGLAPGDCPEAWNLARPAILEEIASSYLEAGAEILTTNTFGGSPMKLRPYRLEDRTEEINRSAVEALRRVAGGRAWISASVGPCGALLEPYGEATEAEVLASFERQILALAEGGADLLCVETMIDLREAALALRAARTAAPGLTVLATMTFDATPRGFFTVMGVSLEQAARGLEEAGADAIGSNCGNGSETMVEIARQCRQCSGLPLVIQPNAGLPENRQGRLVYPETPRMMARRAREMADLGVAVIGGCCGTGPEHVRAIRAEMAC
jgi:5-methyltetrahydrofolate--homocysteine methyltransferase